MLNSEQNEYTFLEKLQSISYSHHRDIRLELSSNLLNTDYFKITKTHPILAEKLFGGKLEMSESELRDKINIYLKKELEFIYSVPTKYENAYHFSILNKLVAEIELSLAQLNCKLNDKIVIGTLPTGSIDGQTLIDPNNGNYLILIESGVFAFADYFSKVIGMCLVRESPDSESFEWKGEHYLESIESNPEILERFENVLEACVFGAQPDSYSLEDKYMKEIFLSVLKSESDIGGILKSIKKIPNIPYELTGNTEKVADIIRWIIELFLVAHEYSHIILEHNKKPDKEKYFAKGTDNLYKFPIYDWIREHKADQHALNIVLHLSTKKRINPLLVYWGIESFFYMIETIDKGICFFSDLEYQNFYSSDISHPLPQFRAGYIHSVINSETNDLFFQTELDKSIMRKIIDQLWDKFIKSGGIYGISNDKKISERWNYKLLGEHHVKRNTIGFKSFNLDEWLANNISKY